MEEGGRGRKGGRENGKEKAKTVEKEEGEGERKKECQYKEHTTLHISSIVTGLPNCTGASRY